MDRKLFKFYNSYYQMYKELSDKQKIMFMDALMQVQFLEKHISDIEFTDKMMNLAWSSVKHSIQKQMEGLFQKDGKSYSNPSETTYLLGGGGSDLGSGGGSDPQEEEKVQVQVQVKEKGQVHPITTLRSVPLSLVSIKDNQTHQPRAVYQSLLIDNRFEDEDTMELAIRFIKYRDELYSSTKDKKYGLKTSRAVIGLMKELTSVNDYDKAFQLMEDNEWATFKKEWVKGNI